MENYQVSWEAPAVADERPGVSPAQDHYHVHLGPHSVDVHVGEPLVADFLDITDDPTGWESSVELRDVDGNRIGEKMVGPTLPIDEPTDPMVNLPTNVKVKKIP